MYESIDGINYITSGGGGDDLALLPGLDRFHHFVLVTIENNDVVVKTKKLNGPWLTDLRINTWFKTLDLKRKSLKGLRIILLVIGTAFGIVIGGILLRYIISSLRWRT
jgi:hypothetical protein